MIVKIRIPAGQDLQITCEQNSYVSLLKREVFLALELDERKDNLRLIFSGKMLEPTNKRLCDFKVTLYTSLYIPLYTPLIHPFLILSYLILSYISRVVLDHRRLIRACSGIPAACYSPANNCSCRHIGESLGRRSLVPAGKCIVCSVYSKYSTVSTVQ